MITTEEKMVFKSKTRELEQSFGKKFAEILKKYLIENEISLILEYPNYESAFSAGKTGEVGVTIYTDNEEIAKITNRYISYKANYVLKPSEMYNNRVLFEITMNNHAFYHMLWFDSEIGTPEVVANVFFDENNYLLYNHEEGLYSVDDTELVIWYEGEVADDSSSPLNIEAKFLTELISIVETRVTEEIEEVETIKSLMIARSAEHGIHSIDFLNVNNTRVTLESGFEVIIDFDELRKGFNL